MSVIQQFTVGGEAYNVVRASAVQQDEILSLLTAPIVERLAALGRGEVADDDFLFNFFSSLPFATKQKIDTLMLSRFTKHGSDTMLSMKDFDGKVMELNQLRAKVLLWNLEPFFVYWASEIKKAVKEAEAAAKKASQTE